MKTDENEVKPYEKMMKSVFLANVLGLSPTTHFSQENIPLTMKKESHNDKYYEKLRIEVWKKAIGNESIARGSHYYEKVAKQIREEIGEHLSKDTIRNFMEQRHSPQPKILDIYSSYVLGTSKDSPKTFIDFQNWYHGRSTFSQLNSFLLHSRNRYYILLGGILFIIFLVSLLLYNTQNENKLVQTIYSPKEAISNPEAVKLHQGLPTAELIKTIFSSFPFDSISSTSIHEAQKMIEWLGIREMKINDGEKESFLSGKLPTGCTVVIWPNHKRANDSYDFRIDCEVADQSFTPFHLKISGSVQKVRM